MATKSINKNEVAVNNNIVEMTVYEALNKKNLIEKKLTSILKSNKMFVGVELSSNGDHAVDIEDNGYTTQYTIEAAKDNIKSKYYSTIALIENLSRIKAAINLSNALTEVTIAGSTYKISEAISKFRNIDYEIDFYKRISSNISVISAHIKEHNLNYCDPDRVATYISKILADSKKIDNNMVEQLRSNYIESVTWNLFDPMNIKDLANKKLDELTAFKEEFHSRLTTVNCTTNIKIEFVES